MLVHTEQTLKRLKDYFTFQILTNNTLGKPFSWMTNSYEPNGVEWQHRPRVKYTSVSNPRILAQNTQENYINPRSHPHIDQTIGLYLGAYCSIQSVGMTVLTYLTVSEQVSFFMTSTVWLFPSPAMLSCPPHLLCTPEHASSSLQCSRMLHL